MADDQEVPSINLREIARRRAESTDAIRLRLEHERKMGERGWVGLVLGGGGEKQGNIAATMLILLVVLFAVVLFYYGDTPPAAGSLPSISKKEALAIIGGFITLTLGYVFGRSSA